MVTDRLRALARLSPRPLYIVGGYVRNSLLGLEDTDVDLASELTPKDLRCILLDTPYKVLTKSERMGTVEIVYGDECYEHTTFRADSYAGGRHQPDEVVLGVSLREDARRRDFTVNAIYRDVLTGEVVDFYGGRDDLEARVIRCVETPEYVFDADGLRILRMVRLASELGFCVEERTFAVARECVGRLGEISGERKYAEVVKMLASDRRYPISPASAPADAVDMLNRLGAWSSVLGLGDMSVPTEYVHHNLYKFLANIYKDFGEYSIDEYVERVFGARGLKRSNREKRLLREVLYVEYEFGWDWVSLARLDMYDEVCAVMRECDSAVLDRLTALEASARDAGVPLELRGLAVSALPLIALGVEPRRVGALLRALHGAVLRGEVANDEEILTEMGLKMYKETV